MTLYLGLLFLAIAIAAAGAFMIFWPLALVHIRDRHPALKTTLGMGAFYKPAALWWLLRGGYRDTSDRQLSGLATPARVSLAVTILGAILALVLETIGGSGA